MRAPSLNFIVDPTPNPTTTAERESRLLDPGFGDHFTDHMVTVSYKANLGWHNPTVSARAPFLIDPAALVLHYAQEVFEGLKAYRLPDGGAGLFRPDANARRFIQSAERLAMPPVPEELFLESIQQLVSIDRDWIPAGEGCALYLRPFMFATEALIGQRPSSEYRFMVIATAVGAYFKSNAGGISIWISDNYTRAAPGGTGMAKFGGNYASSLLAQQEAVREGCYQVVYLDAVERRWIEELGGMNVFFVFADGSIQTPPLSGTILPGITRDSLLTIARDQGLTVREEPYAIDQWERDARSGWMREAFACGTAAVVTPIGHVRGRNSDFTIGDGHSSTISSMLKDRLVAIQRGTAPDHHGWTNRVF